MVSHEAEMISLLNSAHLASDHRKIVTYLTSIKEIAFYRETKLLGKAVQEVAAFHTHRIAAVKKCVLSFLEEAIRVDEQHLKTLFQVATFMIASGTSESCTKKIYHNLFNYVHQAVLRVANVGNTYEDINQAKEMWNILTDQFTQAKDMMDSADDEVLPYNIKYLQQLILIFSVPSSQEYRDRSRSSRDPDQLTLRNIPFPHSLLRREDLTDLGEQFTQELCHRLIMNEEHRNPFSTLLYCMSINVVALLSCLRPCLTHLTIPCLIQVGEQLSQKQLKYADKPTVLATLQSNLLKLLRLPILLERADAVLEVLNKIGATQQGKIAFEKAKLEKTRMNKMKTAIVSAKRSSTTQENLTESSRVDAITKKRKVTQATTSLPVATTAITIESLSSMAIEQVVDIIIMNMKYLPSPSTSYHDKHKSFQEILQTIATPSSVITMEVFLQKTRDPRRRKDVKNTSSSCSLDKIFNKEQAEELSCLILQQQDQSQLPAPEAEGIVSITLDNQIQVKVLKLEDKMRLETIEQAIHRMLKAEKGMLLTGKTSLWIRILIKLSTNRWFVRTSSINQVGIPCFYQHIIDFVLEKHRQRYPLLIHLVYQEFTYDSKMQLLKASKTKNETNVNLWSCYKQLVPSILSQLIEKINPTASEDRLVFRSFLTVIPVMTKEILATIQTLFNNANGIVLGITTLRDFIVENFAIRKACMKILLTYTSHIEKNLRNSAIRCVANQLFNNEAHQEEIETYATKLLDYLVLPIDAIKLEKKEEKAKSEQIFIKSEDEPKSEQEPKLEQEQKSEQEPKLEQELKSKQELKTEQELKSEEDQKSEQELKTEQEPKSEEEKKSNAVPKVEEIKKNTTKSVIDDVLMKDYEDNNEKSLSIHSVNDLVDTGMSDLIFYANDLESKLCDFSSPTTEDDCLCRLELYLAICAKKSCLFSKLLVVYVNSNELVRETIYRSIEKLVKHIKQKEGEETVMELLKGVQESSLGLVSHIIEILSQKTKPSEDLVSSVVSLYKSHKEIKEIASILIPVLPCFSLERLKLVLNDLLLLPDIRLEIVISKLVEVTPTEFLLLLHHLNVEEDHILQKRVIKSISLCLEKENVYTSDVFLLVVKQLIEEQVIPKLTLRTVILSFTTYPKLRKHILILLSRLIERKVWEMEKTLWKGFVKCVAVIQPFSFALLLHLENEKLKELFEMEKELLIPFKLFISQPEWKIKLNQEMKKFLEIEDDDDEKQEKQNILKEERKEIEDKDDDKEVKQEEVQDNPTSMEVET